MPYDTVEQAERANSGLAKYSAKAKRGWLKSFNSCMESGGPEGKCFEVAHSVANKVDGGESSSDARADRPGRRIMTDEDAARELVAAVRELTGAGFVEEAMALKMKGYVKAFAKAVGQFRHEANEFLSKMTGAVDNPTSLAEFPYIGAVIEELRDQKRGVLPMTFMNDGDLVEVLTRVVCKDRGTC
jgi:hypothetical protein